MEAIVDIAVRRHPAATTGPLVHRGRDHAAVVAGAAEPPVPGRRGLVAAGRADGDGILISS